MATALTMQKRAMSTPEQVVFLKLWVLHLFVHVQYVWHREVHEAIGIIAQAPDRSAIAHSASAVPAQKR